jgi:hypothetical protein
VPILLLIFAASLKPNSTPWCAVMILLVLCVKGVVVRSSLESGWWVSEAYRGKHALQC